MIQVSSNIDGVIERLNEFQNSASGVIAETFSNPAWMRRARMVARDALAGVANSEQQFYIPRFVEEVTVSVWGNTMQFQLTAPDLSTLSDDYELPNVTYYDVLNWVKAPVVSGKGTPGEDPRSGKVKKAMDIPLSDEDLASKIFYIIQYKYKGRSGDAWVGLEDRVARFVELDKRSSINVGLWLSVVLDAWKFLVLSVMPQEIMNRIDEAWRKSKSAMK